MLEQANDLYEALTQRLHRAIPQHAQGLTAYIRADEDAAEMAFQYQDGDGQRQNFTSVDQVRWIDADGQISELARQLHALFVQEGQEPWTWMKFSVNRGGQFKVDLSYEPIEWIDDVLEDV